jgi:hypothetical protein
MYFLKAHDEAYQPTPEEIAERDAQLAAHRAELQRKRAVEQALAAFTAKKYAEVVALLEPYEDSLTGSTAAKLRFAQKRTGKG